MFVRFERAGGFAPSAMKLSYAVNTDEISADDDAELKKLIANADIARLADQTRVSAPRPDIFYYRITIEDEEGSHTIEASDADMAATLRPLIIWLTKRSRPA